MVSTTISGSSNPDCASMTDRTRQLRGMSRAFDAVTAANELADAIYQPDASLVLFYCSSRYDLPVLAAEIKGRFGNQNVIGCTTAGEITPCGYLDGALTGISLAGADFDVVTTRIPTLQQYEFSQGEALSRSLLADLRDREIQPTGQNTFGFLLIDGLSMREETVVASLYRALGDIPVFGGSAGDGTRFQATQLYHKGEFHNDCALVSLVSTPRPFEVFKTEHFVPTDRKMVITEANASRRLVTEINGRPAALEYARLVDLPVEELTPLAFATHPVMVRVGGANFLRSIQKVNSDQSLTFFCAIDEGIVLTVGESVDLIADLEELFAGIHERIGEPELVLGCDCILRHLEIEQNGIREGVSSILSANNVIGFSTYGEQFNAMHVNQTFTGVAIGREGSQA